jgi:antitoxin HicB
MLYAFDVKKMKVEQHVFYYIESKCIKGCVAQGDTLDEALTLFEELEKECYETAMKYNIPIEETVESVTSYSGKLLLRMPKTLHKRLAENALLEGVSINQLAIAALSEQIGYIDGVKDTLKSYKKKQVERVSSAILECSKRSGNNKNTVEYPNNYIVGRKFA